MGRQKIWTGVIKEDCREIGIMTNDAYAIAQDRYERNVTRGGSPLESCRARLCDTAKRKLSKSKSLAQVREGLIIISTAHNRTIRFVSIENL